MIRTKHHYYAYILVVLAAGIVMLIGQALDAAVTLQPGHDPLAVARQSCDPSIRPYSTINDNTVNRYLCCEAACRAYCGYEATCQASCLPACAP